MVRSGGCSCFLRDRGRPAARAVTISPEPLLREAFLYPETKERWRRWSATTHRRSRRSGRRSGPTSSRSTSRTPTRPSSASSASKSYVVEMLPVSVGRPPHGAHAQLHDRRRDHAHAAPQGDAGAAADGLRRVRPAGRERRDQGRRPPAHRHRAQHRDRSASRCTGWAGRSTGAARSRPPTRPTTAGRSGCSCASTRRGSPTARRRRSSGARTTRPCSRTSR